MFPFADLVSGNNLWIEEALRKGVHSELQKGEMASAAVAAAAAFAAFVAAAAFAAFTAAAAAAAIPRILTFCPPQLTKQG